MFEKRRVRLRRATFVIAVLVVAAVVVAFVYSRNRNTDRPSTADEPTQLASPPSVEQQPDTAVELPQPQTQSRIQPPPRPESVPELIEKTVESTVEPNEQAAALIDKAVALLDENPPKIIEARDRLNELLPMGMSPQQRTFVKDKLNELSQDWLFTRTVYPEDKLCAVYKVQSGDLLSTISKQFKVPYELLMQINGIARPELLQAGTTIKVVQGPFHTRVYRSTFTMDIYLQNTYVASFPVGLGKPGMETPTGLWRVKLGGKLVRPTWTDPVSGRTYEAEDPDYPLGSRWIGLEGLEGDAFGRGGFAIHGTKEPEQIGQQGSQGCIRLHNGDAILMYKLLMEGESLVKVVD